MEAIEHVAAVLAAYRQGHLDGVTQGLEAAKVMEGWDFAHKVQENSETVPVTVTRDFPPDEPDPKNVPDPYGDVDFFTRIPDVPEQTRLSELEERVGLIERHFVGVDFVG